MFDFIDILFNKNNSVLGYHIQCKVWVLKQSQNCWSMLNLHFK